MLFGGGVDASHAFGGADVGVGIGFWIGLLVKGVCFGSGEEVEWFFSSRSLLYLWIQATTSRDCSLPGVTGRDRNSSGQRIGLHMG